MRDAVGKPRVNTDRSEEIGIGPAEDNRHRPAGRQTRDVDSIAVQTITPYDFSRKPSDNAGLALTALLVGMTKPMPTLQPIGARRLHWICDTTSPRFRQHVHTRSNGEVIGRLVTPMEHDDERQWLSVIDAR